MRCYYVLVRGRLHWLPGRSAQDAIGATRPYGFYCHRYVIAANEAGAVETAFRRVRLNLDSELGWVRDGFVNLALEAEEVATAPISKLLKPDNRGHTFFADD